VRSSTKGLPVAIKLQTIGSFDCLDFCQLALAHLTCKYLAHHELESALIIITVIFLHSHADAMHGSHRHTEDMDLHSVNYLHYGAPKVWYCIPPSDRQKMDAFVAKKLYAQHGRCREFMRHKVGSD